MTTVKDRLPWYSFNKIFSYNSFYNVVMGARGTGKTYGAKKKGIRDAIKHGKQFIYVRRYKDELKQSRATFFADIESEFPHHVFRIRGGVGQVAEITDKGDPEWKTICFFISLSTSGQVKSQAFPHVHLIIYDEFAIEDNGFVRYIPNEVRVFNEFYSTVDRYRGQVRVLFLSNSVSVMNPFFLEWNIEPSSRDEWLTVENGFVTVHIDKSEKFQSEVFKTPFGKFIAQTEYGEYAVKNIFHDNKTDLLAPKTSESLYRFTLEINQYLTVSVWYDKFESCFFVQEKLPKQNIVFTLIKKNISADKILLLKTDKKLMNLLSAYRIGKVFFDKPQTRNEFQKLL